MIPQAQRIKSLIGGDYLDLNSSSIVEDLSYLELNKIEGVTIRNSPGNDFTDLSILEKIPNIKRLNLLLINEPDLAPLYQLNRLEVLLLQTSGKRKIDFSKFKRLSHCAFSWRKGSSSIFDLPSLKYLSVSAFPNQDMHELRNLTNLNELTIINSKRLESLTGIEALNDLESLTLAYLPNLNNLSHLSKSENLRSLRILSCKRIQDYRPLRKNVNLLSLNLENVGTIDSISFLTELKKLKRLVLLGDTKVADKDLSLVLNLPDLTDFIGNNRRGYNPSVKQVREHLSRRNSL